MTDVARRRIGVIVEWQAVRNDWVDHRWRVTAVLDGAPALADWTCLADTSEVRTYYAGAAELELYPRETDTLKFNIEGEPAIYVFLRATPDAPGMALLGATVCVGEAHAHADTGADLVEPVPMPAAIRDWIAEFVAAHHVERESFKRRREGVSAEGGRRRREPAT